MNCYQYCSYYDFLEAVCEKNLRNFQFDSTTCGLWLWDLNFPRISTTIGWPIEFYNHWFEVFQQLNFPKSSSSLEKLWSLPLSVPNSCFHPKSRNVTWQTGELSEWLPKPLESFLLDLSARFLPYVDPVLLQIAQFLFLCIYTQDDRNLVFNRHPACPSQERSKLLFVWPSSQILCGQISLKCRITKKCQAWLSNNAGFAPQPSSFWVHDVFTVVISETTALRSQFAWARQEGPPQKQSHVVSTSCLQVICRELSLTECFLWYAQSRDGLGREI